MNRSAPSARIFALVAGLSALSLASTAHAAPNLSAWKQAIGNVATPGEGCFTASYPSVTWHRVACTVAPLRPFMPRDGRAGRTVGDGNDYAAVSAGLTTKATGSFPVVSGVKTEKNNGNSSEYSLQLNSNFSAASPACAKAKKPASCLGWEQFVFSEDGGQEGSGVLFVQYWLIDYNKACPSGWMKFSKDCFRNSDSSIGVPKQTIKQLANLQLSGQASKSLDTSTLVTAAKAYTMTGKDNILGLVKFWNASEFNIIGNGNGSEATFNKGASITVQIALKDGTTVAPICQANAGTTAETNNLNLGACTASGGASPSVTFTQSR